MTNNDCDWLLKYFNDGNWLMKCEWLQLIVEIILIVNDWHNEKNDFWLMKWQWSKLIDDSNIFRHDINYNMLD